MIMRVPERQNTAHTQACGSCSVVELIESHGAEQLWPAGPKSDGKGADTRLMNDSCRSRKHSGVRQVGKGGYVGGQLLL